MRKLGLVLAAVAMVAFAGTAIAGKGGKGNGAPEGAHYTLNLIGMEADKKVKMTGSNRHTIFVSLNKNGGSANNIYLVQGDFKVCDGNALDTAYKCDTTPLKAGTIGAVFQLPCNTANVYENDDDQDCGDTGGLSLEYYVYIKQLGNTSNDSTIELKCGSTPTTDDFCDANSPILFHKKDGFMDVTNELTVVKNSVKGSYPLFTDQAEYFWWEYDAKGARVSQLRFYYDKNGS